MPTDDVWAPRWRGQRGRLEVWYATFTDRTSGAGLWLHHEHVVPPDTGDLTRAWMAWFPADGPPQWERCEAIELTPTGSAGSAGELSWDLTWDSSGQRPLYTFPRWAWERELLPGCQIVAAPTLEVAGTVQGRTFAGHGNVARIYGHGNAARWAWLHADLGDGDVVELVAAVSTQPGLRLLPPVTHLRWRLGGRDGPSLQGPSLGLRARLDLPTWTVAGRIGRQKVRIEVTQPEDRCVSIGYVDPDGATATCTNTERADVSIRIGERSWRLPGTGHAEVGTRP